MKIALFLCVRKRRLDNVYIDCLIQLFSHCSYFGKCNQIHENEEKK